MEGLEMTLKVMGFIIVILMVYNALTDTEEKRTKRRIADMVYAAKYSRKEE